MIIIRWISLESGHPHGWQNRREKSRSDWEVKSSSQAPTAHFAEKRWRVVSPPHEIAAEDGKKGWVVWWWRVYRPGKKGFKNHSLFAEASKDDKPSSRW
jgi:hypothetical protein